MSKNRKAIIDDGMCPDLLVGADFDGFLGIPIVKKPSKLIIPTGITPFSYRNRIQNSSEAIGFYEMDENFSDILIDSKKYAEEFKDKIVITPDCSLYRNAPYSVAVTNTYKNRTVGYVLQELGAYVIPQVRWGNSLTYTNELFPDKLAFLGVEKHSIYAIGTYGCIQTKDDKEEFKAGLKAMIETLEPEVVLGYDSMPKSGFDDFMGATKCVQDPDWTTRCHGGGSNG
ncbi:MAG: DUF4417 domain-containing protein [Clostridia bacterium]|nr:DUF4417 domain-containing protein [Clostridia bacterium]